MRCSAGSGLAEHAFHPDNCFMTTSLPMTPGHKAQHTAKWARTMTKWLVTYNRRKGVKWTGGQPSAGHPIAQYDSTALLRLGAMQLVLEIHNLGAGAIDDTRLVHDVIGAHLG